LHFKGIAEANSSAIRYLEAVEKDKKSIDYLVISGDMSDRCSEEGYRGARVFIERLTEGLKIQKASYRSQVLIIPGNHDVDFHHSRNAFTYLGLIPNSESTPGDHLLEHGVLRPTQREYDETRYQRFSEILYQPLFGTDYPTRAEDQATFVTSGTDDLALIGLNSAYKIDHIQKKRAGIHLDALNAGMSLFRRFLAGHPEGKCLVVFHHPVGLRVGAIRREELEMAKHDDVIAFLRGDSHVVDLDQNNSMIAGLPTIIGGGFGGVSSDQLAGGVRWGFDYIEVDWAERKAFTTSRTKHAENGIWVPNPVYTVGGKLTDTTIIAEWS